MYEIAMDTKYHTEERRDDINKFYISLFAAIISVTPFILTAIDKTHVSFSFTISIFLFSLATIGISLSISWILMLQRMNFYLKGVENFVIGLERKYNKQFVIQVAEYLDQKNAPDRITKQQLIIPYVFTIIFIVMLISIIIYAIK